MGDGDLVDPAQQGIDESEQALPGPERADVEPVYDDTGPERASEIDDVTDTVGRHTDSKVDVEDIDVEALLAERDEYRALAQRVQADFDNFRRRAGAQAQTEAERASGRLAEALLPVLDAAEAAYLQHPDEIGPLLNQMLTELKRHGLETLDLHGEPFDPEVAEAVAHEPATGGDPVVAEVLRTGYRWKGRTLRPAMVKTTD
jgi:molecular chaperone GrpE